MNAVAIGEATQVYFQCIRLLSQGHHFFIYILTKKFYWYHFFYIFFNKLQFVNSLPTIFEHWVNNIIHLNLSHTDECIKMHVCIQQNHPRQHPFLQPLVLG